MKKTYPYTANRPEIPAEEIEALVKKIKKEAVRNLLLFVGFKAAMYYGLYRLSKYARKNA
jgi:hypothetical protein